ncbi:MULTISPECIES: PilZ domain-containing protein [Pseudomonas]|uniref:Pilus assembly protein PilZ n=1 Tax=Pseudomonas kuykendallii TaxID=1007099 RepID=A0A2W5D3S7_9PSED|nr:MULTISPECIES: PilZ domain-containing protein [Pseudomonas]PZP23997.1 MAG: pilus assembly protein PilZ [Pseudomonas kuykendallii]
MRRFLRHPSDMPIELKLRDQQRLPRQRLNNISLGGVACNCTERLQNGTPIELRIPLFGDDATCNGVIAWCEKEASGYLVGITFIDEDTLFKARMVQQVCQIERYRREREEQLGTQLGIEDVAQEWMSAHAEEFSRDSFDHH